MLNICGVFREVIFYMVINVEHLWCLFGEKSCFTETEIEVHQMLDAVAWWPGTSPKHSPSTPSNMS